MKFLNLGCGRHFHPDWVNVDFVSTGEGVIAHNLRYGIPFPDNTFDAVYHSHVLEHLPLSEAAPFLRECFRALQPGGILRVVVPDLEQIARLYITALEHASAGHPDWDAHYQWILLEMYDQTVRTYSGGQMAAYLGQHPLPNQAFVIQRLGREAEDIITALRQHPFHPQPSIDPSLEREQVLQEFLGTEDYQALQIGRFRQSGEVHQWMYDRHSVGQLLQQTGFDQIRLCQAGESFIPEFARYGLEVEPDGSVRKPDSLFMEAIKPIAPVTNPSALTAPTTVQPPKPLEELSAVRALRAKLETQQAEWERSHDLIQTTQTKLQQVQERLQRLETELEHSHSIIRAMESSKFWKLRSLWLKLKRAIGLTE